MSGTGMRKIMESLKFVVEKYSDIYDPSGLLETLTYCPYFVLTDVEKGVKMEFSFDAALKRAEILEHNASYIECYASDGKKLGTLAITSAVSYMNVPEQFKWTTDF